MKLLCLIASVILNSSANAENLSGKYELKSSKINYLVTYLIKKADGDSVQSKGKGECIEACEFLIAAPVKSFESKDSNRDLNMLNITKADKFPLVVARIKTKVGIINSQLLSDIEIEFSGVKKTYSNIAFKITPSADGFHAEGKFDLLLDYHKIVKPSLLGVDINDLVPVTIVADWKKI
jgi:hypothetical protein